MRKIIFLTAVLICFTFSTKVQAKDQFGMDYPAVWRSSSSCGRVNFAVLSTGTIIINSIIVGSPTINVESFVTVYNSSSPSTMTGSVSNLNIDTAAFTATNTSAARPLPPGTKIEWNIPLSSGGVINAEGLACRDILWNYPQSKGITYNHTVILRP